MLLFLLFCEFSLTYPNKNFMKDVAYFTAEISLNSRAVLATQVNPEK